MIPFELKRSVRARYMRLRVLPGGSVTVTAPAWSGARAIERFVSEHTPWIERAIARMSQFKTLPVSGRKAYLKHREEVRAFMVERVKYWNTFYGFSYGRISIKNTKRLWGSCSRKGNLNFSYTLFFLPRELADYVVVHELCHLGEHNHSKNFWALVSKAMPDYMARRKELRRYLPR